MDNSNIVEMAGYELSKEIHAKKVSCAEVMGAYLERIEKVNPRVNAIVSLQESDGLMAQAKEKDEQLAAGNDNGWMHGFPSAVKDMEMTKGVPTTMGSLIFKDFVPTNDGSTAARMREAGAIFIGKTNVPEFGYGSNTNNKVFGATGNPYDVSKTAGGSSGGAACALALRMQPVADGSDFMGSLRNPAGWCNVYGFRPSVGTVPFVGGDVFGNTYATCGPMGRTVADMALLLGTQAGYTVKVPISRGTDSRLKELTPENVLDKLNKDPKGVKIAWVGDWDGYLATEDGVLATTEKTLESLSAIGVTVEKIKPFYDPQKFWEKVWLPIRHYSAGSLKVHMDAGKRELMNPMAVWEYDGSVGLIAQKVYEAFAERTAFYNAMMKVYEDYDFIASPSAQLFPFDKNNLWPTEIAGREMTSYHKYMEVVTHWTMGGNAIAAVPAGFGGANNLSIGIQLVAKPGFDFELLQFARAYEEFTDFVGKHRPAEA